jgi:hypothetical protein
VSLSFDGGAFSEVYEIDGAGDYVDSGINTYIGGSTIGSNPIGGGSADTAHPFKVSFPINADRFQTVRVKFEAQDVGYIQVNEYSYLDIRDKGIKRLPVNTV